MPRPIDDELDARVVALTREGMSAPEIAVVLKITARTVARIRKRRGCQVRPAPRPFSADEVATIEAMLAEGVSTQEVARTIGRSKSAIRRRWPEHRWTRTEVGEYAALLRRMRAIVPGV